MKFMIYQSIHKLGCGNLKRTSVLMKIVTQSIEATHTGESLQYNGNQKHALVQSVRRVQR